MGENTLIGWAHDTHNFWMGCDKVAPECAKCYIDRVMARMGLDPWSQLYRTKNWKQLLTWERRCAAANEYRRVFTCSLSDFFHVKADEWRPEAWEMIKQTPHLVYLVLTKRPERIEKHLPPDWGDGYPNVWLGVSSGCLPTLNKMDTLRRIPCALRFLSAEPLLEEISDAINLNGFGWVITGGESGTGEEYLWDPAANWRLEFDTDGRRTMKLEWARWLMNRCTIAGIPFYFKQITSPRPGWGANALGTLAHEFPTIYGKWSAVA